MATLGIYNLKPIGFTQENIQVVKHHSKSLYIIPDFYFFLISETATQKVWAQEMVC